MRPTTPRMAKPENTAQALPDCPLVRTASNTNRGTYELRNKLIFAQLAMMTGGYSIVGSASGDADL